MGANASTAMGGFALSSAGGSVPGALPSVTESASHPGSPHALPPQPAGGTLGGAPAASAQLSGGAAVVAVAGASAGAASTTQAAVYMGGRVIPEEAMQEMKIHKGSRGHAITALVHIPPSEDDPPGHLGYLWFYLSK